MKVVTGAQMREIDRKTIEERGVPGEKLMELAGQAVAVHVLEAYDADRIAVLAGKGNNGGDGFVAARILNQRGKLVNLFLVASPDELKGDALMMYQRLPPDVAQAIVQNGHNLKTVLPEFDLLVDALLGTGVKGKVTGLMADVIEEMNASKIPIVSVDIPSGLGADGGPIEEPVIQASSTVTMGLPKLGMVVQPGVDKTGTVTVVPLRFPPDLLEDDSITVNLAGLEGIRQRLPVRPRDGNKHTFGYLLVIAGSRGLTGAAILTARAAQRSGAGLIFVAMTEVLGPILESQILEAVKIPIPSASGDRFDLSSRDAILDNAKRMDAVALGPGLGQDEQTFLLVHDLVRQFDKPLVLDADGLNALVGHTALHRERRAPTIITPHPGEMGRLIGKSASEIQEDRFGAARSFAEKHGVIVVLKGAQTLIADPSGQVYINPTGVTGLAKGGSGDLLTGLIGGLLAQRMKPLDAAISGVFIHGLAGDLCSEDIGVHAMIPSDVLEHFGGAFQKVLASSHD
ncbi:MAG: NAD(P)H-hydrate dehydratase [bacterium]